MCNIIVHQNFPLQNYHSFGTPAQCKFFAQVNHYQEIIKLLEQPEYAGLPYFLLGSGSNILFFDDFFPGIVIQFIHHGITVLEEDQNFVWVRATAGESWDNLVDYALKYNYGGIENLAGIPGTVGAAPVQNIGAYGVELKDTLVKVECYDSIHRVEKIFSLPECQFGYRQSIFQQYPQYWIYAIVLKLHKNPILQTKYAAINQEIQRSGKPPQNVAEMASLIRNIRKRRLPDPKILGNAGSFFKNPYISIQQYDELKKQYPDIVGYPEAEQVKIAAGWLIEQCGFKGKRINHVGTFEYQALILVNYGGATCQEILEFAQQIQEAVFMKFHITLKQEVVIVKSHNYLILKIL